MKIIYVVHEIEGSSILGAFESRQDARDYLYFCESQGKIRECDYTVKEVWLK